MPQRRTSASETVVCRFALEPPASASLRRGKPAGMLQYFANHVLQIHQCYRANTLPSPNANSSLPFPSALCIFKTYAPLFLICGNAKRKSEHKKFWKRIGGAGGKERTFFKRFFLSPAGKVPQRRTSASETVVCRFALEPPASASLRRGKPAGMLRYFHFDSIPMHTMCRKSTSVTVQTPVPASNINSSLHFPSALLHFQNLCPAFSYLRKRKKKKRAGSTRRHVVGCRFALEPPIAQLPCMPCVINPPMLPGKHPSLPRI